MTHKLPEAFLETRHSRPIILKKGPVALPALRFCCWTLLYDVRGFQGDIL